MKVWDHIFISLVASMLMCPGVPNDLVNSISFKFDPELTKAGPSDPSRVKLTNKIDWMGDLAVRLNEQLKAIEKALDSPNSLESSICRLSVLGPLNEQEDIKRDLYTSFKENLERMERSTVMVKDLDTKIYMPADKHIFQMDYLYIDDCGDELSGRALHISDKFFNLPEKEMLDKLIRAVFAVVNEFWAEEFMVARAKIAGQVLVFPHPQDRPFDSETYDLVAATVDNKENYRRIMSLPAGVRLSHLNPNVYSFFASCLDIATRNDYPHIKRVNLKV